MNTELNTPADPHAAYRLSLYDSLAKRTIDTWSPDFRETDLNDLLTTLTAFYDYHHPDGASFSGSLTGTSH